MKIRLMGTREELKSMIGLFDLAFASDNVLCTTVSNFYPNRNSNEMYRVYVDITLKSPGQEFKIGKLEENKLYLRRYVGDGETKSGKKFDISVHNDFSPIVVSGKRSYTLTWSEILDLAKASGLFSDKAIGDRND